MTTDLVAAWREATATYRREREQSADKMVPLRFDLIVAQGDRLARVVESLLGTPLTQQPQPLLGVGLNNVIPCPTCQLPDGSPNVPFLKAEGACTMCGQGVIPWGEGGAGFCSRCKDHSANELQCEACGKTWADWENGKWAVMT